MPMQDKDERIARLLDQLENPNITTQEIDKIERKLQILRALEE